MPPLLPITLPPPPLECPHLVERESQRLRKLGNSVPASFPRPAFHAPYGGHGHPALLGEFLYGKPPLLPYPPQLQAQPFVAHAAALFKAASRASRACFSSLMPLFTATSPSSTRRPMQNQRRLLPTTTQAPSPRTCRRWPSLRHSTGQRRSTPQATRNSPVCAQ